MVLLLYTFYSKIVHTDRIIPPHKTYYSLLDILRFFAAFWVMNFHYFAGSALVVVAWYRYGNLGVQLFFIVSGFVIVQSLQGKTIKEFARGRFIRLFPLFWALCTITYILSLIVPYTTHVSFLGYLVNMTMLPDVFIGYIHRGSLIDASYWTLTVELLFYVGVGLFCAVFSYKNIRYFLAGWLVLSMIAFLFHVDKNFYVKLLLVRHASYFVFGSALALVVIKHATNLYQSYFDKILLVVAALYSICIHARATDPYPISNPRDASIETLILMSFFIITPCAVYFSTRIKNQNIIRVFAVIGGLTYPLYLLHQRIGNILISYSMSIGIGNIRWSTFVIVFEVGIIVLAYVVYLQDKKVRTWIQRKFDSKTSV